MTRIVRIIGGCDCGCFLEFQMTGIVWRIGGGDRGSRFIICITREIGRVGRRFFVGRLNMGISTTWGLATSR
jgi:hypothetical protein